MERSTRILARILPSAGSGILGGWQLRNRILVESNGAIVDATIIEPPTGKVIEIMETGREEISLSSPL